MKDQLIKNGDNKVNILGVWVSSTKLGEVLTKIDEVCSSSFKKPFFMVTVYSESLLNNDRQFRSAIEKADLVVADGVSVAAAADYVQNRTSAVQTAANIFRDKYHDRPTGIKIFRSVLESGKYKVYLSGGFNGVAEKLAKKYSSVVGWDGGDKNVAKINAAGPDILFVSLGRFKQEVWIGQNLDKLSAKVVIGVGSAFDEVAENWQVPSWVEQMGLKWLWRVTRDPKHIVRALNALRFPYSVFLQKLSS